MKYLRVFVDYIKNHPLMSLVWMGFVALTAFFIVFDSKLNPNYQDYRGFVIAISITVVADWITGIVSSIKKNALITSKKLSKTIWKIFSYLLIFLTTLCLELYLKIPAICKVVSIYIAFGEFFSILENMFKICGRNFNELIQKLNSIISTHLIKK